MASDLAAGRRVALLALGAITFVAVIITVIIVDAPDRRALIAIGRLIVTVLTCLLVWRGRVWARWLLGFLVIFGGFGFIAGAARIGFGRPLGFLWLLLGVLYTLSFIVLVGARTSRAFLAT